jgi:hypothetical protein
MFPNKQRLQIGFVKVKVKSIMLEVPSILKRYTFFKESDFVYSFLYLLGSGVIATDINYFNLLLLI